jgi:hypothetical protein
MDKKQARKELQNLRDSITKVLGESSNEDISEHIQEAQESAREGAKALKKSLLERIKDLPVVNQVSQLGAAGTVAVSTAAVTQVDIAKDRTEIFIAEVAQDVVEERFEVPMFIDNFVDFASLNDWGQEVIAEKIQEAQSFVAEVSESPQTSQTSYETEDTKPETSASSKDNFSDKPSETEEPQEPKSEKSEPKESKSSSEPTEEPKEVKPSDDPQEESKDDTEQSEAKSDAIDKIETPMEDVDDPIKPHDLVNPSPVQ